MKFFKNLGIALFVIYAIACVGLYFAQDRIIFLPYPLPEDYVFRAGEEVEIEVEDGISLNCLWLKEPNSKGVIFYLHGNRGSLKRCLYQARQMDGNNYDIFLHDYRGYGKSDGKIKSEAQIHADNQKVYDYLKQHYSEDQIVLVGYSLGSGMASYLASKNNPQQLVLLAPYYSMVDLKDQRAPIIPDFLLKYKLKSNEFLQNVNFPVTLFHGTRDEVIPYDSSEKLKALKPDLIELVTLRNEGHRGTIFNPTFKNTLRKLLR
jgi:pimeloyl-ACP methyl ester carboxylesterase